MHTPPFQPGGSIGPYTLIAPVACGGMATVWRARHTALDCERALKISLDPRQDRHLRLEGVLQARLRHPTLVQALDLLHHQDRVVLVMELVLGPDIQTWLRSRGALSPAEAVTIAHRLCEGIACVHAEGVVHRDLSPRNVLMEPQKGGLASPRVVDFGISLVRSRPEPDDADARGTPRVMAPEQLINFGGVDQRADVFSLGCILQELVTGQPAFPQRESMAILRAIHNGDVAPLPAGVPEPLQRVIRRCITVEPSGRYPDAGALCDALGRLQLCQEPEEELALDDDEATAITLRPRSATEVHRLISPIVTPCPPLRAASLIVPPVAKPPEGSPSADGALQTPQTAAMPSKRPARVPLRLRAPPSPPSAPRPKIPAPPLIPRASSLPLAAGLTALMTLSALTFVLAALFTAR